MADDSASGRFMLRIDPALHRALRAAAEQSGLSLNAYCSRKLAIPLPARPEPAAGIVLAASELLGDDLAAVVAYGSWVRDELTQASDLDVLLVVRRSVDLTRDLYRRWDEQERTWGSHPVEPHFIHVRDGSDPISGLWAEAAIEGVVLFEHGFETSRELARIRAEIAGGVLERRRLHGQSYWVRGVA